METYYTKRQLASYISWVRSSPFRVTVNPYLALAYGQWFKNATIPKTVMKSYASYQF
jgi:hypothetical protein